LESKYATKQILADPIVCDLQTNQVLMGAVKKQVLEKHNNKICHSKQKKSEKYFFPLCQNFPCECDIIF
jgi:hypothetical protein